MQLLKRLFMVFATLCILTMIVFVSPLGDILVNYLFYTTGESTADVPEEIVSKVPDQLGIWTVDENGWIFQDSQQQVVKSKAYNVGGVDYLFNKKGYMETGWTKTNDTWYYLSYSGQRESGWIENDGKDYYLDKDGQMAVGWQTINSKKYHFEDDGTLSQGWLKQEDKYYYIESDGTPHIGWLVDGDTYYYLDKKGIMQTGWVKDSDLWYYMNPDGDMTTGWQTIDQKKYYFSEMGALHTGWLEDDGKTYFFDNEGSISKGFITLGDYTYYMDLGSGAMRTGWVVDQKKAHYLNTKGILEPNKKSVFSGLTIALTFDDGPTGYTDRILNALENNNAKATFFVHGNQVDSYPDTIKRMRSLGNQIGSHSYDNTALTGLNKKELAAQIKKTSKKVKAITGKGTSLVRPPGGSYTEEMRSNLTNPFILWSLDTQDATSQDSTTIAELVLNSIKDGDIVLLHASYGSSAEAAEILIPALTSMGCKVTTVSELAKAKGTKIEKKQIYKNFP